MYWTCLKYVSYFKYIELIQYTDQQKVDQKVANSWN